MAIISFDNLFYYLVFFLKNTIIIALFAFLSFNMEKELGVNSFNHQASKVALHLITDDTKENN
jgi:hypothetical protein